MHLSDYEVVLCSWACQLRQGSWQGQDHRGGRRQIQREKQRMRIRAEHSMPRWQRKEPVTCICIWETTALFPKGRLSAYSIWIIRPFPNTRATFSGWQKREEEWRLSQTIFPRALCFAGTAAFIYVRFRPQRSQDALNRASAYKQISVIFWASEPKYDAFSWWEKNKG